MLLVDTNILLYAANEDAPEHKQCLKELENLRRSHSPWYLTWGIVYEFLRVVTHPRVFAKPLKLRGAWEFVEALLASPALIILSESENHARAVAELTRDYAMMSGNILHDFHKAALMREHGIKKILTHDADFYRFKFLEVVDPLGE